MATPKSKRDESVQSLGYIQWVTHKHLPEANNDCIYNVHMITCEANNDLC